MPLLHWFLPWDFSITVLVCCLGLVLLYARGTRAAAARGQAPTRWRRLTFYTGVLLVYLPLQTRYDYLAQHMFWLHRLQHFLLHDFASFLVALSWPWPMLGEGLPGSWRAPLRSFWRTRAVRNLYAVVTQPLIAFTLFVGLIYLWLWPSVHFRAMLSLTEYKWMNWSVALDGLLFWSLIFDPRSKEEGAAMRLGTRIPLALLTMVPETIIGAYLSLHQGTVYTVYDICGRLWPLDAITDQQIGGLITWIPASMMCSAAALVVMRRWMYNDERLHQRRAASGRAAAAAAASPAGAVQSTLDLPTLAADRP